MKLFHGPRSSRGNLVIGFLMFLSLSIVLSVVAIGVIPFAFQKKGELPEIRVKRIAGEVWAYSPGRGVIISLKENDPVSLYDRIRVGEKSALELAIGRGISVQLKENSEVKVTHADWFVRNAFYSLTLAEGTLAVNNAEEGRSIQIAVPARAFRFGLQHLDFELAISAPIVTLKNGLFLIQFDRTKQKGWMGFLRGAGDVRAGMFTEFLKMKDAEKVEFKDGKLLAPTNLTRSEWTEKAA